MTCAASRNRHDERLLVVRGWQRYPRTLFHHRASPGRAWPGRRVSYTAQHTAAAPGRRGGGRADGCAMGGQVRVALLATMGSRGDVQPFFPLAQELGARGHPAALFAPADFDSIQRVISGDRRAWMHAVMRGLRECDASLCFRVRGSAARRRTRARRRAVRGVRRAARATALSPSYCNCVLCRDTSHG